MGGLLNCPHCGGVAYNARLVGSAWFINADHTEDCLSSDFQRTEADAVRRWNTRTPSEAALVEAVQNYVNAKDDFRLFERTYPNDSTNRWDRVFEAVNTAEGELRAALAAAKGERV